MYCYDGIVEEFEDYLDYAADKRFEKKPEELFDKYADWTMANVKTLPEWREQTISDYLMEKGEDYVFESVKACADNYANDSEIESDADEFEDMNLIDFNGLQYFVREQVLNPKSDFAMRFNALDPKDRDGQNALIFETYTRGCLEGGEMEMISDHFMECYDWPDPEDIVAAKNSGTYAQLKKSFCDGVRGKTHNDGRDKGGM